MPLLDPGERDVLSAYLLHERIAGDTRTPRSNVVGNAEKLAEGDPDKFLGLGPSGLSTPEIMAAVAGLCGCSPDPADREGPGVIDPARTLAGMEAVAERLAGAARRGERVLACTGHPSGLLALYQRVARALDLAGAKMLVLAEDVPVGRDRAGRSVRVRYLDGVGVLTDGASLLHTHESHAMERLLDEAGDPPDLVLADHGFAGTAASRGVETVAFTDVNDPALAVAHARGLLNAVVPLDDNLPPRVYAPLGALLERAIVA